MFAKLKQRSDQAFTLIEIMLVIAIIGLLASLAIPNVLRSRINANETVAIHNVRLISTALENYRASQQPAAYPDELETLGETVPPYVDTEIAAGARAGYLFVYSQVNDNEYDVTATPEVENVTGSRTFFVDETGVIRLDGEDGDSI